MNGITVIGWAITRTLGIEDMGMACPRAHITTGLDEAEIPHHKPLCQSSELFVVAT